VTHTGSWAFDPVVEVTYWSEEMYVFRNECSERRNRDEQVRFTHSEDAS